MLGAQFSPQVSVVRNGKYLQFRNTGLRSPAVVTGESFRRVDELQCDLQMFCYDRRIKLTGLNSSFGFHDPSAGWRLSALTAVLGQISKAHPMLQELRINTMPWYNAGSEWGMIETGGAGILHLNFMKISQTCGANLTMLLFGHELGHLIDDAHIRFRPDAFPELFTDPIKYSDVDVMPDNFRGKPFPVKAAPQLRAFIVQQMNMDYFWHSDFFCDFTIAYLFLGTALRRFVAEQAQAGFTGMPAFYDFIKESVFAGREYVNAD